MNIGDVLSKFIGGIKTLNVPRLEDLPYWTSPPVQFVYQSTANLALGVYQWADVPSALTPNRPLLQGALYFFRHITMAADIEELDFTSNIVTTPSFQIYLKNDARTPRFREPVLMPMFLEQFDYRYLWKTPTVNDQLFAGFTGVLTQGAGLIGKASVTLTAIISAQEIVDDKFIKPFTEKSYPKVED